MVNHLKTHKMYQKTSDWHSKDEEFNKVSGMPTLQKKLRRRILVESESLQTASMAWADRGGGVIEVFHVTPRGRWGCWLIKWCQSEEFSFHRLPCCLSPLRWWWYVGGRTNEEMEVSQRSEGADENHLVFVPPTCSHTPMLLTYYILLILLTDKWFLGPTLIYLGQRQSRFSPSSCFCRIWCLFLTSGAA